MKSVGHKELQIGIVGAFFIGIVLWFAHPALLRAQSAMQSVAPADATPWRPRSADARFVGRETCAQCHTNEAAAQHATPMGKALEPVAESQILRSHQRLTFRLGAFSYQIMRQGNQSIYSVTDGTQTISEPILYSFGQGKAGQTYVFRHNGSFYESRLSFYREIQGLDITIGYAHTAPTTLDDALGRAISMDEARSCFGCHATAAVANRQLQLERLIPGVSCEACHGPGGEHVEAMRTRDFEHKRIFNPANLSTDELTQEFCGSCHRSAETVLSVGLQGKIDNVRFQPYRIFTSRGHDPDDARLGCTACHNPHENVQHEAAFYDVKCFACHQSGAARNSPRVAKAELTQGRKDKPCPVAARDCVTCHMPKVELSGAHFKFTDHRIRIAHPGEPYPN